jgi:hypothetical protein
MSSSKRKKADSEQVQADAPVRRKQGFDDFRKELERVHKLAASLEICSGSAAVGLESGGKVLVEVAPASSAEDAGALEAAQALALELLAEDGGLQQPERKKHQIEQIFRPNEYVEYYNNERNRWAPALVISYVAAYDFYWLDCDEYPAPAEYVRQGLGPGTLVEYFSKSAQKWVPAKVVSPLTSSSVYHLDCQARAHSETVRRRGCGIDEASRIELKHIYADRGIAKRRNGEHKQIEDCLAPADKIVESRSLQEHLGSVNEDSLDFPDLAAPRAEAPAVPPKARPKKKPKKCVELGDDMLSHSGARDCPDNAAEESVISSVPLGHGKNGELKQSKKCLDELIPHSNSHDSPNGSAKASPTSSDAPMSLENQEQQHQQSKAYFVPGDKFLRLYLSKIRDCLKTSALGSEVLKQESLAILSVSQAPSNNPEQKQSKECFGPGDRILYYSSSKGQWLPGKVCSFCEQENLYDLDIKGRVPAENLRRL